MALGPGQVAFTNCRLNVLRLDAGRLNWLAERPTTPYNPTPAPGSVGGPFQLSWFADGAANYDVFFGVSASDLPLVSAGQTGTTYTLPPLLSGQTYFWRITARNSYGQTSGPVWSFSASTPLQQPTNPSPVDHALNVTPNLPLLSWTGATDPGISYRVYFGLTGTSLPLVASGLTVPQWVAPQLANGTNYSWRVEAVNNAGGTVSATWTFTTATLGAPTNPTPSHHAVDVSVTTSLSWTAVPNATSYDVWTYDATGAGTQVASGLTATSWTPPAPLLFGTGHGWSVVARNAAGQMPGPVWVFTTERIGPATNPYPPVGGANIPNEITFTWTPGAHALTFDVYLSSGGAAYQAVATGLTTPSWTPPVPLKNGTQYVWIVRSWNGSQSTDLPIDAPIFWFSTWQLLAPTNPSPVNGAITVPVTAALSWAPVANATGYDVYFGTSSPPPLVSSNQPGTMWDPPGSLSLTQNYIWRIVARNAGGTTNGPLWAFTPRTPFVPTYPTSYLIEANLGPGFRSRLITEANTVAVYPLADDARLRAQDIAGHNRHGTYQGFGFESGVSFDVPEGAIGTRFTGLGFVEVPDSGTGPFNLSLAGGDMDLVILIREYVSDAVNRGLISKYDAATNGYHLSIYSGVVNFYLRVNGVLMFDLWATVAIDAGEHLITASYRTVHHEAFITIDGVQRGIATGLSGIEPQYTTAALRIGAHNGVVAGDGNGVRAVLAYAALGREGDIDLAPALQATRAWTDLTPHLRTGPRPIETRVGIPGSRPEDTVATTGTLSFVLDNGPRTGVLGYYTPSHPNCRTGWAIGVPVRLSISYLGMTDREFHGRLATVTPLPGVRGPRYVDCTVTDWMDVAASSPLSALETQINRRSDDVIRAVLGQAQGRSPVAQDLHAGAATFPFAVDVSESEADTLLTEFGRVVASERGYLYIRGDMARGGRLVYESRIERASDPAPAFIIDNTMQGVEVAYGLEGLINIVRIEYTPRRVDSTPQVLYSLDITRSSQPIAAGESLVLEGGYVDPAQEVARVGGTQLIPLMPGVDYGFRSNEDGSGTNLTNNLRVTQRLGGSSFRVEFINSGPAGFLWVKAGVAMQIRGLGIYHFQPVTVERRDNNSVRLRGPRPLQIVLPYETNGPVAQAIAEAYLQLYGTERPIPSSVTINGNARADFMYQALALQIGDKLGVRETLTGIGATAGYYIHEKRLTLAAPGILTVTFGLAPAPVPLVGLAAVPSVVLVPFGLVPAP